MVTFTLKLANSLGVQMNETDKTFEGQDKSDQLGRLFVKVLQAATGQLTPAKIGDAEPPPASPALSLRVALDGVGKVEAVIGVPGGISPAKGFSGLDAITPIDLPLSREDRVKKAKDLLATGDKYTQGCSGFVTAVLGIPWEAANDLMGVSSTSVGDNNNYSGLTPGDIAGWKADSGSGHVTVYVGENGTKFIDVRSEGEAPRKIGNGYGPGRPLYKSSRF